MALPQMKPRRYTHRYQLWESVWIAEHISIFKTIHHQQAHHRSRNGFAKVGNNFRLLLILWKEDKGRETSDLCAQCNTN